MRIKIGGIVYPNLGCVTEISTLKKSMKRLKRCCGSRPKLLAKSLSPDTVNIISGVGFKCKTCGRKVKKQKTFLNAQNEWNRGL